MESHTRRREALWCMTHFPPFPQPKINKLSVVSVRLQIDIQYCGGWVSDSLSTKRELTPTQRIMRALSASVIRRRCSIITWSFRLGYISGRFLFIVSLRVCSRPQQTRYFAWIIALAETSPPPKKITAFCDSCELSNTKKYVIARSLRQRTRLEYHGQLRNHPRSQLVDG